MQSLHQLEDVTRIVQKFLLGRGDLDDLAAVHKTIKLWSSIRDRVRLEKAMEERERSLIEGVEWAGLESILLRMFPLENLADKINKSLTKRNDSADAELTEGGPSVTIASSQPRPGEWTVTPQ